MRGEACEKEDVREESESLLEPIPPSRGSERRVRGEKEQ